MRDITGLTEQEVRNRVERGDTNVPPEPLTRSYPRIVADNTLTFFNLVIAVLTVLVVSVGDLKNALFAIIAIVNSGIGIFQEIRAKRKVDALAIVAETTVVVVRDRSRLQIKQRDVVVDDVLFVETGNQLVADGTVLCSTGLEVDESALTGESHPVKKSEGDRLLSGSFVVAGNAYFTATAVGHSSYASKLSHEARKEKRPKSALLSTLNRIIKYLSFALVPVGGALFATNYLRFHDYPNAVLGSTASMVGMIPEGLMLLTSVAFAIGSLNLARHRTLVQSMPSIEALARVDTLCLDKTGTITDGTLVVDSLSPVGNATSEELREVLAALSKALPDNNATSKAVRDFATGSPTWTVESLLPFSSKRKLSAVTFAERGTFALGAPDFVVLRLDGNLKAQVEAWTDEGHRVLGIAWSSSPLEKDAPPDDLSLIGFVIITDTIRPEAKHTLATFAEAGVDIKIISGDDPRTVSSICERVGLANSDVYIDMHEVAQDADMKAIAQQYTIFGRVLPHQKKDLVAGLKALGHTVGMTGDGVNDVLALKEADCSIAMASGSDAAKDVSDIVLLDCNFASMVEAVKEGRRVVNNIEGVAALYLVKTIYTVILSLLFIFLPFDYPFEPIQLTLISALTVGAPSFLLTLEPNFKKLTGKFLPKVLRHAIPAALVVVVDVLVTMVAGSLFDWSLTMQSTVCVMLTGVVGFALLAHISRPWNTLKSVLYTVLVIAFFGAMVTMQAFFSLSPLWSPIVLLALPLIPVSIGLFIALTRIAERHFDGKKYVTVR